jgi:hypothetical protein
MIKMDEEVKNEWYIEQNEFEVKSKTSYNTILLKSNTSSPKSFIEPHGTDRLYSKRNGICNITYPNPSVKMNVILYTKTDRLVLGPYYGEYKFDISVGDVIHITTTDEIESGTCINFDVQTKRDDRVYSIQEILHRQEM